MMHFAGIVAHGFSSRPFRRSAKSPISLVERFADNPDIGTLHDNFV
jgi:hypothetical protein